MAQAVSLVKRIEHAARKMGADVLSLEINDRLPQTFQPSTWRTQPGRFFSPAYEQPFYQTAFQWRTASGDRRLVVIDPIIKLDSDGFYREDHGAMAKQLLGLIVSSSNNQNPVAYKLEEAM